MNWTKLTSEAELIDIVKKSHTEPQIIFKHSTRCGTSYLVKENLEDSDLPEKTEFHLLDLISHRSLSDQIAKLFTVRHESPQVLVIKDGICIYNKAHSGIRIQGIINQLSPAIE